MPQNVSGALSRRSIRSADAVEPVVQTIAETIAGRLRTEILTGAIRPGHRLHQVSIAARFGVSATPVREAFALLSQEGLITSRAHKGAVVLGGVEEDLRESFDVRIALETFAMRAAIVNLTDDDIARIRELVTRYVRMGRVTPGEVQDLVAEFFDAIYVACNNRKLHKNIQELRAATDVYLLLMATDRPNSCLDRRADTISQYQEICVACAERDPERAVSAVVDYLRQTAEVVLQYLALVSESE
jgi:DNA-binding GntR family transcriptional regulator